MNFSDFEKMIESWNRRTQALTPELSKYTLPLFKSIGGESTYLGSAVLFKFENGYYLLSASHVLETKDIDNILVPTTEISMRKFPTIGIVSTPIPKSGKREDDKIDIAVLKLYNPTFIEELKSYKQFLDFSKIEFDEPISFGLPNQIVCGFPDHRMKFDPIKKGWKASLFVFLFRISSFNKYEKYNCNKETHIFLEYPKYLQQESSNDPLVISKNPHGISGCGVWQIEKSNSINEDSLEYKLIGIIIEFQSKYHRVLIASRLKPIKEFLKSFKNIYKRCEKE
jgi:hypothetical protein